MSSTAELLRVFPFPVKPSRHKSKSSRIPKSHKESPKALTFTLFLLSPRVITVYYNLLTYYTYFELKRLDVVRRSDINEEYPTLLYVCRESCSIVHPLYTSIFPSPSHRAHKWHYTASRRALDLANVRSELGRKLLNPQNTALNDLIKAFETTMNSQPPAVTATQLYTAFAAFYRRPKDTACPIFFNPTRDILYLRRSPPSHHFVTGRFLTGLWAPKKHLQAQLIRHLAIEFANLTYPGPQIGETYTRRWCTQFASTALTGLESLALICLKDHEVITFTLDTTDLLRAKDWSYSLSLSLPSKTNFVPQMEDKKTSVTWNARLAVAEGKNLWQLAKAWRPVWDEWEDEKRSICEGLGEEIEMVGEEWLMTMRVYGWCRMLRKPELVGGENGKTWMGKSRAGR